MYKRASRGTGGTGGNGRAKVAKVPSRYAYELAAAQTAFGRSLVLDPKYDSAESIRALGNQHLTDLIRNLTDSYTTDKIILRLNRQIEVNGGTLSNHEIYIAAVAIRDLVKRLARYRTKS